MFGHRITIETNILAPMIPGSSLNNLINNRLTTESHTDHLVKCAQQIDDTGFYQETSACNVTRHVRRPRLPPRAFNSELIRQAVAGARRMRLSVCLSRCLNFAWNDVI